MSRIQHIKTSFTAGEVDEHLLGRGDLAAYENGARKLRNVFIAPTGGVRRRAGLRFISKIHGPGRLVAFEFNTEQTYLFVFTDKRLTIFRGEQMIEAGLTTPWHDIHLANLSWTQSADTLLVVHPDIEPQKISRTANEDWLLEPWTFLAAENGRIWQPHHKFAANHVTMRATVTNGTGQLIASEPFFHPYHPLSRFRIKDKELRMISYASPTVANIKTIDKLVDTAATRDWSEQTFSRVRGWPNTCAFHQDRLVIGGSQELPNHIWMSKTSDLFNFDLGEGLDDEAISFSVLSDQVNAIRAVFSSRHLQVFTSGGEWMVSGDPLTPETVQLRRQTRIGSRTSHAIPPRDVDGATVFISRNGRQLREFLFADVEQAYRAGDLSLLAEHVLQDVVDLAVDSENRLVHVVRGDGQLATVTMYRAEQVTAWSLNETQGEILAVEVVSGQTFVLVKRGASVLLEVFDETVFTDSTIVESTPLPRLACTGLEHLNGTTVDVIADGTVAPRDIVDDGTLTLDHAASETQVGLPFSVVIEPLPLVQHGGGRASGPPFRVVSATFRVAGTRSLRVNLGNGFVDAPLRHVGTYATGDPTPAQTADIKLRSLGWQANALSPLWRIEQDQPMPLSLLSVSLELKVNT